MAQTATGQYAAFLFKDRYDQQQHITIHWNGQSDRAPSLSTVYLQIFNRNSSTWETLASNNAAAADTDFDLQAVVTQNLDNYFDGDGYIACRIYQEAI